MTTLDNGKKSICFSFSDEVYDIDMNKNASMFLIEMPTVICTNRNDAAYIQDRVNSFISEISRELLK